MQTVPDTFHDIAQNGIRPHKWGLWISFDKQFDDSIEFGEWDSSLWDGGDIWKPSDDNPLQEWDYYVYEDYSDRVIDMEWSREIEFPYSVQAAMADFTVNNYDNLFSPDQGSPIDQYILPKRPLRMFAGFRNSAVLQQFVGVTEKMPELDSVNKKAAFHALDFLSEMFTMPLTQTVAMANVTTDEVLDALFQQFGLTSSQYTLAQGRNRIPFLFFERGMNAGEAFRQLMQAEMGNLWIDEQGIIRFEQRLLPVEDVVMEFNDSNVEEISTSSDSEIINTVRIHSIIRDVQEFQPVYMKSNNSSSTGFFVVPAGDTAVMEVNLQDPCLSIVSPTLGESTSVSWFTAKDAVNNPVSSDVSVASTELKQNTYVITFQNDNAFSVEIDALELWGEPAKEVDRIDYEAYDEDSVTAYGEELLEIDNNMFGSESNCESFALTILDAYKDFASVIEMSVKGDPSLQLGDIVDVNTRDVQGTFKVIKITNTMRDGRAQQILKARKYTPRNWAFWDESLWDGGDLWAP